MLISVIKITSERLHSKRLRMVCDRATITGSFTAVAHVAVAEKECGRTGTGTQGLSLMVRALYNIPRSFSAPVSFRGSLWVHAQAASSKMGLSWFRADSGSLAYRASTLPLSYRATRSTGYTQEIWHVKMTNFQTVIGFNILLFTLFKIQHTCINIHSIQITNRLWWV